MTYENIILLLQEGSQASDFNNLHDKKILEPLITEMENDDRFQDSKQKEWLEETKKDLESLKDGDDLENAARNESLLDKIVSRLWWVVKFPNVICVEEYNRQQAEYNHLLALKMIGDKT